MSKRKYRATKIQAIDPAKLSAEKLGRRVVVAIDVAKEDFFAAIVNEEGKVHLIVKWVQPAESRAFLGLVQQLGGSERRVEVIMEPSGTYGDVLRAALSKDGVPVFRVSPKRVHDAAEVYDGVPSLHDAKAATIIAKLHLDQLSEPWPLEPEHRRRLAAALKILELHDKEVRRNQGRLEALMGRYWPGTLSILNSGSATMQEVLIEFGGPAAVADQEDKARKLMRRVGRHFLTQEKIDTLIESARGSLGVPQLEEERLLVIEVASETRRHQKAANRARARVEKLALVEDSETKALAPIVGRTTAAVLVASVGEPTRYACPSAYVKALGLNLKEKSSGKQKGTLKITKRGPGIARTYLYFAVMRMVRDDRIVRAWYANKVRRDGGKMKLKALVSLMRKLASALWHVAHGAVFDSSKLFDVTRLGLTQTKDEVLQPSNT